MRNLISMTQNCFKKSASERMGMPFGFSGQHFAMYDTLDDNFFTFNFKGYHVAFFKQDAAIALLLKMNVSAKRMSIWHIGKAFAEIKQAISILGGGFGVTLFSDVISKGKEVLKGCLGKGDSKQSHAPLYLSCNDKRSSSVVKNLTEDSASSTDWMICSSVAGTPGRTQSLDVSKGLFSVTNITPFISFSICKGLLFKAVSSMVTSNVRILI
jgi:hypothetical protein